MTVGTPDPHVLGVGLAPTPFTADEIRAGCPQGRVVRLLVEPSYGEPYVRVNRFAACDAEGATIESWIAVEDGEPTCGVMSAHSTWLDLQGHAAFPVGSTTIDEGTVDLPFGTLPCLRYSLDSGERFWFALSRPGMPVKFETPDGDGWVDVTTMISDERCRSA